MQYKKFISKSMDNRINNINLEKQEYVPDILINFNRILTGQEKIDTPSIP